MTDRKPLKKNNKQTNEIEKSSKLTISNLHNFNKKLENLI